MIHSILTASGRAVLPEEPDFLSQLNCEHEVKKQKTDESNYDSELQFLRNHSGLAAPLRISMERFAAKCVGRLPFMRSSKVMDEVITGRNERISFSDLDNDSEVEKPHRPPHMVMELEFGWI